MDDDDGFEPSRMRSFVNMLIGFVAGFSFFMGMVAVDETYLRPPLSSDNDNTTVASSHRRLESKQRDFLEIATRTGTDKVWGTNKFQRCLENPNMCVKKDMENPKCRVLQGHFYDSIYNKYLGPYSTDDTEPFQFLEIGHYNGK